MKIPYGTQAVVDLQNLKKLYKSGASQVPFENIKRIVSESINYSPYLFESDGETYISTSPSKDNSSICENVTSLKRFIKPISDGDFDKNEKLFKEQVDRVNWADIRKQMLSESNWNFDDETDVQIKLDDERIHDEMHDKPTQEKKKIIKFSGFIEFYSYIKLSEEHNHDNTEECCKDKFLETLENDWDLYEYVTDIDINENSVIDYNKAVAAMFCSLNFDISMPLYHFSDKDNITEESIQEFVTTSINVCFASTDYGYLNQVDIENIEVGDVEIKESEDFPNNMEEGIHELTDFSQGGDIGLGD